MRGAWVEISFGASGYGIQCVSLPVRGAWVEIKASISHVRLVESLPVRGAWVEITTSEYFFPPTTSLPVRGAWVEMELVSIPRRPSVCRSPCGERGLKFRAGLVHEQLGLSLPVRGAWVEMGLSCAGSGFALSLPVRGAWVEIGRWAAKNFLATVSLPVRGAWVEIFRGGACASPSVVAPRAGSGG